MKIKEIILKGFKSYGRRTRLSKLSPNLTCITGFNGSGKSNILDGICFVLGLQAYSLARVDKIQELVYKNGQSGITEASVSIVFEDLDHRLRDLPFLRNKSTLTVTRKIKHEKSKYSLNNKRVTLGAVKKLFKSIGLNMDNPNSFFVKQGTVSQIVNFKPKELLQLVEECAGVNYYNTIKNGFDRALNKQDTKILQIDSIYAHELKPEIAKLQAEMQVVGEFNRGSRELRVLEKNKRRIQKFLAKNRVESLKKKLKTLSREALEKDNEISEKEQSIVSLGINIKNLGSRNSFSDETSQIEQNIEDLQQQLQTVETFIQGYKDTRLRNKTNTIANVEDEVNRLVKFIHEKSVDLKFCVKDKEDLLEQISRKRDFLRSLKDSFRQNDGKRSKT